MKNRQEIGTSGDLAPELSSRRNKPPGHDESESEWERPVTDESLAWLNSPDCLETINIIAKNSNMGCWDRKPHVSIQMDSDETDAYTHMLLNHGMQCYFTDRCPMLPKLKCWAF